MAHVVLLGDSIFDNAAYVPGQPRLTEQVAAYGHEVSLLAVDGSVTADVVGQSQKISAAATHLALSVGGNDALQQAY